jgi:poly-gamma-glutamate synthesis protein (capsule biosynthesis protein)
VGDALVKAGFNVIQTATNHIDDFGYDYIAQSFNFWKNYPDVTVIGTHETAEDADTIQIREVNDIRIAFLNYTYGTNGDGGGNDRDYLIDIFSKNKVASDIQKAKSMSDCIIVAAHWGNDNDSTPSEYEKQWATFLMQQGVDVIIGSNPHVLQPYGRLTDDQGNSTLVFYSLGNFVSSQTQLVNLLGVMAAFTIQKTVQNGITTVEITDSELRPLVMHYNSDTPVYTVYMLDDYTEDLASTHSVKDWIGDEFTLSNLQSKFDEIMSMNVTPSTSTDLLGENEDSTTYYKY